MTEVGQDGGAARRRGLGMGLSALLGTSQDELPTVGSERSRLVPIEFLRPCPLQPRRRFGEDELAALADSIRHRGVMQPLLVRRAPSGADHYEIIAGERRWRAAQMAGAHELPVIVHELSDRDALEVALLENVQRQDLSALEEAEGYRRLIEEFGHTQEALAGALGKSRSHIANLLRLLENVQRQDLSALEEAEGYRRLIEEFGHTQEALAGALGKSRSHIANLLRLLGLPPAVRTLLEGGELSAGHARALLGAREPVGLAKVVVGRGLNVRQTEALVRADAERPERRRQGSPAKDPNTLALERDLSTRLGLPVSLTPRGTGGTLQIAYGSLDQLDDLLRRLG